MVQTRRQLINKQQENNTVTNIVANTVTNTATNITHKEFEVNIDFDDASKEWHANKKNIGNSHYKYICEITTKSGKQCGKVCYKCELYCWSHRKHNK